MLALLPALGACMPSPDPAAGRVSSAGCDAWWLDLTGDLVPQGLEIDRSTAYITGHRAPVLHGGPATCAF